MLLFPLVKVFLCQVFIDKNSKGPDSPGTSDDLFFLLPIAEATNYGPWRSYGASCSICSSADSMSTLDIRFFIEVKLLFEYLLYFGLVLSQVSSSSSRIPSI